MFEYLRKRWGGYVSAMLILLVAAALMEAAQPWFKNQFQGPVRLRNLCLLLVAHAARRYGLGPAIMVALGSIFIGDGSVFERPMPWQLSAGEMIRLGLYAAATLLIAWYISRLHSARQDLTQMVSRATADLQSANASLAQQVEQRRAAEVDARRAADFLDRIINKTTDPIFAKDDQSHFVLVNDAMCALMKTPREELLGQDGFERSAPEVAAVYRTADQRVLTTGTEEVTEESAPRDRSRIMLTKKNRFIEEGGRRYLIAIARDVTDLKRAEKRIARLNSNLSVELAQNEAMLAALRESEDRFRRAIVDAPLPIIIHAEDGEILEVSATWMQITGYGREDLRTMAQWLALAHEERAAAVAQDIQKAYRLDHRVDAGEYVIKTRTGEKRTWHFSVGPLGQLSDGRRIVIAMATDVTNLKQAQERLRTRAAALDAAADMVVITDRNGIIMYVNTAFTSGTGYTSEEAVGQRTSILKSGRHDAAFYRQIWETIHAGQPWTGEMVNRRKDGVLYTEEMSITPVRDEHGTIDRFVAIKRDIEARKRARRIEEERNSLASAVQGMEKVLGVVGHELRTPLASLRAMAELLMTEEIQGTDQADHFIRSIHDESVRMANMISDLLEVARVNSGAARWNWSCFRVEESCRAAVESLSRLIDPAAVTLEFHLATPELEMRGDVDSVRRLVLNLLTNAAKHTRTGRIDVTARRAAGDGEDWVELEIADTGTGISPEVAIRLGDAFALNSGIVGANQVSGAGLGLAVCRGIVAAHGGTVHVESAPGAGTKVTVRLRRDLPAAVAAPPAAIRYQPRAPETVS